MVLTIEIERPNERSVGHITLGLRPGLIFSVPEGALSYGWFRLAPLPSQVDLVGLAVVGFFGWAIIGGHASFVLIGGLEQHEALDTDSTEQTR